MKKGRFDFLTSNQPVLGTWSGIKLKQWTDGRRSQADWTFVRRRKTRTALRTTTTTTTTTTRMTTKKAFHLPCAKHRSSARHICSPHLLASSARRNLLVHSMHVTLSSHRAEPWCWSMVQWSLVLVHGTLADGEHAANEIPINYTPTKKKKREEKKHFGQSWKWPTSRRERWQEKKDKKVDRVKKKTTKKNEKHLNEKKRKL